MSMLYIFAEYVWIDAYGSLRSKNRILRWKSNMPPVHILSCQLYPEWNFDGSSTGQASTVNSEVNIKPVKCYRDPFNSDTNSKRYVLVLCETYLPNGNPHPTNQRVKADHIFNTYPLEYPWYGLEQEFFIMRNGRPLGFPKNINEWPNPQGQYYCSVGSNNAYGRKIVWEAYNKSLEAGVHVCGMNGEVAPGQWEIQVGICEGIEAGDDTWMLRYILNRVAENHGLEISYHAKPVTDKNDTWNGSGMHTNFSTKNMRGENGIKYILEATGKLEIAHKHHLQVYGSDNTLRMSGKNETSSMDKFTYSVGGRSTSVRIPTQVEKDGKGYLEDRRPSSSADPYEVIGALLETCAHRP